jgi:hypothetical protein
MEIDLGAINGKNWRVFVIFIILGYCWLRTISYRTPENREENGLDRIFSGLHYFILKNFLRLIVIYACMAVSATAASYILTYQNIHSFQDFAGTVGFLFIWFLFIGGALFLWIRMANPPER